MLQVSAYIVRDAFSLEVAFSSDARITCLFGRSGAGKTTVAELVAGLIRPVRGRVDVAAGGDGAGVDADRVGRLLGVAVAAGILRPGAGGRRRGNGAGLC